jgi:hypothetical protein
MPHAPRTSPQDRPIGTTALARPLAQQHAAAHATDRLIMVHATDRLIKIERRRPTHVVHHSPAAHALELLLRDLARVVGVA